MQNEALRDSPFDPLKLRRNLWETTNTGSGTLQCKSCANAKVIWIQPAGSSIEPDWSQWGRIFQWLGPSGSSKWTVFWFPAEKKRLLPEHGEDVGPANLNGGYCYPCNPNIIVVYRFEEATRVLLHEILHAACTDPQGAPLPIKEATTETWAELFLVALCSKGNEERAKQLWANQSQWIANQNDVLSRKYSVHSMEDYAWRYTIGRSYILEIYHISLPNPKDEKTNSSRLTHPSLCA